MITKAFILGAGLGTRMRPLTDHIPKPMVEINGQSLIRRSLEKLNAAGVEDVVINTHYKAETLRTHLDGWEKPRIHWSHEDVLLNTGGGIVKALEHFDGEDFFVIAGDALWTEGAGSSALQRLQKHWGPEKMSILVLLQPVRSMRLTQGVGDYVFEDAGMGFGPVKRSPDKTGTHMFANLRINSSEIFKDAPQGAFSFLDLMDACEKEGRLYGLEHDAAWYHISTPGDVKAVNEAFKNAENA